MSLQGLTGMPMGIQPTEMLGPEYDFRTQLRPGDELLLCSDGLFEQREYHEQQGFKALQSCFADCHSPSLTDTAHQLVSGLLGEAQASDDLSLLLLKVRNLSFKAKRPVNSESLDTIGEDLKLWSLQIQLNQTDIAKISLIWLEYSNNLLMHAQANQVEMEVHCDPSGLTLVLRDNGLAWTPAQEMGLPDPWAESGRGLWLIAALSQSAQHTRLNNLNHLEVKLSIQPPKETLCYV